MTLKRNTGDVIWERGGENYLFFFFFHFVFCVFNYSSTVLLNAQIHNLFYSVLVTIVSAINKYTSTNFFIPI